MNTKSATGQMPATTREQAAGVAHIIRQQVGGGVLMTLGAHDLGYTREGFGGLVFKARILPFNKNGKRGVAPRIMQVQVTLNAHDYYDVAVGYLKGFDWQVHYSTTDVDAATIGRRLLALDYDGDTVLNPRIL